MWGGEGGDDGPCCLCWTRRQGLSMGYPLVEKVKQDFAARHYFLIPQDQKEEGGRKGWKGKLQSQGFDRKKTC